MYKQIIITVVFFVFFSSCKNNNENSEKIKTNVATPVVNEKKVANDLEYKMIDTSVIEALNKSILENKIKDVKAILSFYRPKNNEAEGDYSYSISSKAIDNKSKELTLIEDGIMDDSQKGLKIIMVVENENNSYRVNSIKESYKCWTGRGHENWSAELCK